jgi:hypothetical protein
MNKKTGVIGSGLVGQTLGADTTVLRSVEENIASGLFYCERKVISW